MFDLPTHIYLIGVFVGLLGGFLDSVSGGGGLIVLPILLQLGIDPITALGTNKMQSMFGTFTSFFTHLKSGTIKKESLHIGIVSTLIGAAAGTFLVRAINPDFVAKLMPVMLSGILAYYVLRKNYAASAPRFGIKSVYVCLGLLIGFYDGFFGPGAGVLWTTGLLALLGFNITQATANTKILNFISNVTAFAVFLQGGKVAYILALCMAFGQIVGAFIGSKLAIKKGAAFIRPLMIFAVLIMIARLIYTTWM